MKHQKITRILLSICLLTLLLMGCQETNTASYDEESTSMQSENLDENITFMEPDKRIIELEDGLSMVAFEGNDGFESFLAQGDAFSDSDVIRFLVDSLGDDVLGLLFGNNPFGCSTLTAAGENGETFFGRNFDWNTCEALIVLSTPEDAYASISTVNCDFIDQDTEKPDITTTTAVRLLLNQAADVDEALELLEQYDMHSSMEMMPKFPEIIHLWDTLTTQKSL